MKRRLCILPLLAAAAMADPAIVIHKSSLICGMAGADAKGNMIYGGLGTVQHITSNDNESTLVCKADGIVNLTNRAQSFSGFGCGLNDPQEGILISHDSHATVTPHGSATLTCHFRH